MSRAGDLGSKQEGKKEEEGEKQLPNMSQCDTLIGSLDAQVNRLHQRHAMCTKCVPPAAATATVYPVGTLCCGMRYGKS